MFCPKVTARSGRDHNRVVEFMSALTSTRAIRRYQDEGVPDDVLAALMFAATRAPSGSNRQPFRFLALRDSEVAVAVKTLIGTAARAAWAHKRSADGYDQGSGARDHSPKARMAASMQHYVDNFERVPLLVLPLLIRDRKPYAFEGASIYPACQNLLLAARAYGYGGVLTGWQFAVERQLHELLEIPDNVFLAGTITIGRPVGSHGPVRRRPLHELVFEDRWDCAPEWAVDPPGTQFTQAGPPRPNNPST